MRSGRAGGSESNEAKLKALLQPVHDRLQKYEETVSKVESERKDAFGVFGGKWVAIVVAVLVIGGLIGWLFITA